MTDEKEKWIQYLTFYNRDSKIEYKGNTFKATEEDFNQLNIRGNYWHHRTDPSSWLTSATISHFKNKFTNQLPRLKIIELVAQILNVNVSKIESSLDWSARYNSWHDGGNPDDYHVLPDPNSKPKN